MYLHRRTIKLRTLHKAVMVSVAQERVSLWCYFITTQRFIIIILSLLFLTFRLTVTMFLTIFFNLFIQIVDVNCVIWSDIHSCWLCKKKTEVIYNTSMHVWYSWTSVGFGSDWIRRVWYGGAHICSVTEPHHTHCLVSYIWPGKHVPCIPTNSSIYDTTRYTCILIWNTPTSYDIQWN